MRILLTVHKFFPEHGAGTEVLTLGVAKELQRRGHEVRIFTGDPDPSPLRDDERMDAYAFEGFHVDRFRHGRVPMGGQAVLAELDYDNRLAANNFASIVSEFAPDLVHIFHFNRLGATIVDVAVNANIPAYYTPTDFWAICQPAQLMLPNGDVCAGPSPQSGNCVKHMAVLHQNQFIGALARGLPDALADLAVKFTADGTLPAYPKRAEVLAIHQRKQFLVDRLNWLHAIASPTKMMAETLIRHGVDPEVVVDIGYGIEIGNPRSAVVTLAEAEPLTIGFIGTLAPHKGCHVLIDAFQRLPTGKARLKIYGDPADFPDYAADLQRRAAGSPAISFCGVFPREQIAEVMSGFHVLVVPSLWNENAPLVMYAALAAKRPVIASNLPGLSETVKDSWNGLLFSKGSVPILQERLSRILGNRSLLTTLSRNCGRPKTMAVYVDELLALYAKGPLRDMRKRDYHGLQDIRPVDRIAPV